MRFFIYIATNATHYEYNEQSMVEKVTNAAGATTKCEYTYDNLSRIVEEKVLANSTKICYTYDDLSRVTSRTIKNVSDDSVISTETFTYDAAGNITGVNANTAFVYDTNNRLTSFNGNTVSYDLDGNMLSNGTLTCTYDSANRLVSAGGHTYTYNAENVRIRNLCTDEDTTYIYDTNAKLSRLLCKTTNNVVTKYVYGRGLIGEEIGGTFKTYHFDSRGSTIAITDASGNITDTFAYDTYGKLLNRTGTSAVIFGYNGRDGVVTEDNGLIYMRARYYSPEMKRFINADIVAGEISNAITLNRFAYANGNPVMNIDPTGLFSKPKWMQKLEEGWNTYVAEPVSKAWNTYVVEPVSEAWNTYVAEPVSSFVEEKIVEPALDWTIENAPEPIANFARDIKNYDKNNSSEQTVLESYYFSAYKGKLVLRTNMERSGSVGILFISHNEDNAWDRINTIKHEYGHTKQLDEMSLINYLIFIGLPSWQAWGDDSYYRKPWEITADIYGGVNLNSRIGDDPLTQKHIDNGNDYVEIASSQLPIWEKIQKLKPYY